MLKTFTVAPEQDSVRTAFNQGQGQWAPVARLTLERRLAAFPEYLLEQDGIAVAIIRGKEIVCGGEHFAVIPLRPDNVPYWDGEQRLRTLDVLLSNLSQGWTIPAALDDAVDAEDDEFFAGIPEVAYTGQPEDYPLQVSPGEWEPEPEATPPLSSAPPAKIYPWTFWYHDQEGSSHQVIIEATYEDAQRAWDALSPLFEMTSRRP